MHLCKTPYQELYKIYTQQMNIIEPTQVDIENIAYAKNTLDKMIYVKHNTWVGEIIRLIQDDLNTRIRLKGLNANLYIPGTLPFDFKMNNIVEVEYEIIIVKEKKQRWITTIIHKNENKKDI
jgi:hypothetical protein